MANPKNTEKRYPITINILQRLRFEASPVGKTAHWILTVGKAGVLFTFSIIALTLMYRYTLDRRVEMTRESINENISTIQSYSESEVKIRSFQKKLQFINNLSSASQNSVLFFQKIESNLPKDIFLDTLNIDYQNGSIQLRGKAMNEVVFSQMLNALRKQEEFSEISIDQIQSGGALNPEITFTMNVLLTIKTGDN
jgi:Tfp pilus assembly protein PilN